MDATLSAASNHRLSPAEWPWAKAASPAVSSERTLWQGALIRSWQGTSATMVQPALDQHYIVRHLGGAKRVNRRHDGAAITTIAELGSLTFVPAGTSFVWNTEGPIAFAHLYLKPGQLAKVAAEVLDRDGDRVELIDRVACRDPLLEGLFSRMLHEVHVGCTSSSLLLDSLLESFCVGIARKHVNSPAARGSCSVALAAHRLRRVVEYVEAHLADDVALADLVSVAGLSAYHFSRSFRLSTGLSPYRYVLRRRIENARALLISTNDSLQTISTACGFSSKHQFGMLFKREAGVGPKRFRLAHQGSTPSRLPPM